MNARIACVLVSAMVASGLVVGCKSSTTTDPNAANNFQGQPQPGTTMGPQPTAQPTMQPTATPQPTAQPTAAPTAAATAGPLDPTQAAIAQQLLAPLAAQNAPGMKPVGSTIGGMLQAGQSAQVQFTIEPGKCYTAIGVGLPPVQNVQLEIAASPPAPPMTGLQTQEATINPVLGAKDKCFRMPIPLPIPVPALFKVKAVAGSGMVYAQLYAK